MDQKQYMQLRESLGPVKYAKIQQLIKECLKEGMEVEVTIPKSKLLKEDKNKEILKWDYEKNDWDEIWRAEKNNYFFNIYKLDRNEYNLIVDYRGEEMQNLDSIFDTLEKAKSKAEEILNNIE